MKKLFPIALIALPLCFGSCNDDTTENPELTGSLRIGTTLDLDVEEMYTRATPTTDFSEYYLVLEGPTSWSGTYPEGGVVKDLLAGDYTVTISSHETMPDPEFDVQYYTNSAEISIEAGKEAALPIQLKQGNAGVYFVYDNSLNGTDFENIMATIVTADEKSLEYSEMNRTSVGYFAPGQVEAFFTIDGYPISIRGEQSRTLTLESRQLWEITLSLEDGTRSLIATRSLVE